VNFFAPRRAMSIRPSMAGLSTGVTYCDLTGLRAILSLAGTGRDGQDRSARRLVRHEVPPHLRTILQVTG
jgi:hypothetical protein